MTEIQTPHIKAKAKLLPARPIRKVSRCSKLQEEKGNDRQTMGLYNNNGSKYEGATRIDLLVVWLLWVRAARPLNDNIGSIVTSPHAFFNVFALNQLRQKSSHKCITYQEEDEFHQTP